MLALIVGEGKLPLHLVNALPERPHVAAMEGFQPEGLQPDTVFRIETLGSLIKGLTRIGVSQICFAGAVRRPDLDPTRLDEETKPLVPRLMAALGSGDDAALRVVVSFFEEAGIEVVGAHDVSPDLLPPSGALSAREMMEHDAKDISRAIEAVEALGKLDIGQACVVRKGQVLAMEAMPGTDWMLESLTRFDAQGGLLYKAPKPGQDRRIDLPTIGPETIRGSSRAGLRGVAVEAGGVLVLDPEACRAAADEAGLGLWVCHP